MKPSRESNHVCTPLQFMKRTRDEAWLTWSLAVEHSAETV